MTVDMTLATNNYSISNNQFKITSMRDFGFYSNKNELIYFNGRDDLYSFKVNTTESISFEILKWDSDEYSWLQSSTNEQGKVSYNIHVLKANSLYTIYNGTKSIKAKSDKNGVFKFEVKTSKKAIPLKINSIG